MLQRMAQCEHVLKLIVSFQVEDELHIMTELCAGDTLLDMIKREGGRLPSSTAARILQALAEFANACLSEGSLMQLRLPTKQDPGTVQ